MNILNSIIKCAKKHLSFEELLLLLISCSFDDSNYYIAMYIARLLINIVRYIINEYINQHHNK